MEYWTIALSILAGILAIYYYSTRKDSNVFREHGIPHMKKYSLLERIWILFTRPRSMADMITGLYNVHPDAKYIGTWDYTKPIVVIRDLELLKSVAIKNFDAFPDHLFFGNENQDPLFEKI